MKHLKEISKLIPINKETNFPVNLRDVWEFIESKQEFSHWIKDRIKKYSFEIGIDFHRFDKIVKGDKRGYGNKTIVDYHSTLDMAKEIAMIENNEQGRQVRRYFIEAEKILKQNLISKQPKQIPFSKFLEEAHQRVASAKATNLFRAQLTKYARDFNSFKKYNSIPRFWGIIYRILYNATLNGNKKEVLDYLGVKKKNAVLVDYIIGGGLEFLTHKQFELLSLFKQSEGDLDFVNKQILIDIDYQRKLYIDRLEKDLQSNRNLTTDDTRIIIEFLRQYPLKLSSSKKEIDEEKAGQSYLLDSNQSPVQLHSSISRTVEQLQNG